MLRIVPFIVFVAFVGAAVATGRPTSEPTVVAKIRVGVAPCAAVGSRGLLWVTNYGTGTLSIIDPARNRVVGRVPRIDAQPCGIVSGAGSLWVHAYGTDRLDRIDMRRRKVTRRIEIGSSSFDVLFAAGSVWVTSNSEDLLFRVNPKRNRVVRKIKTPGSPAGLAFAAGAVWVGTNSSHIFRVDPVTNRTRRIEIPDQISPAWFSVGRDSLWVSNVASNTVSRLDPVSGAVLATIKTGQQPVDGVVGPDELVWIPNRADSTITRIDPATNRVVDTLRTGPGPFVLNVAFGDVWSAAYGGQQIWRIRP